MPGPAGARLGMSQVSSTIRCGATDDSAGAVGAGTADCVGRFGMVMVIAGAPQQQRLPAGAVAGSDSEMVSVPQQTPVSSGAAAKKVGESSRTV